MVDESVPRSRRALLAGGLGGLAALAVQALGRPVRVNAADGQTVVVGGEYTSSSPTKITNGSAGDPGIAIWGASTQSVGVYGSSSGAAGVVGETSNGNGVHGFGTSAGVRGQGTSYGVRGDGSVGVAGVGTNIGIQAVGPTGLQAQGTDMAIQVVGVPTTGVHTTGHDQAVYAWSQFGHGLVGETSVGSKQAVLGRASGTTQGTAVYGYSGTGTEPTAPTRTGVYGYAAQGADARGVFGRTSTGQGVRGQATSGYGVRGVADKGSGVGGYATTGIGLRGEATSGYALRTEGRVAFDKSSGTATIASGTNSVLVTPGIDLTTTSTVLATLQGSAGGTTTVHRVSVNPSTNQFRIHLTANATASVKVGWLVFG